MIFDFTRYSRDGAFEAPARNESFVVGMAAGSIAGSFVSGRLLGLAPSTLLPPAPILVLSSGRCGARMRPSPSMRHALREDALRHAAR